MMPKRQGEDHTTSSQAARSAGATPTDIQETTPRRVSFARYHKNSSTVGPRAEKIPGDPVAFRREDYLSRPPWLLDIGRYPITLCPRVGDDGVPQKTSTGAPIYTMEERNVCRPSRNMDTSQCAHIIHHGARAQRKSSTRAPDFVTADQAGRRSTKFTDSGQFPPMPSVSPEEDRGGRKSSIAFATEDGRIHTPSWLDNPYKYTTIAGPRTPEGGAPRRPSIGASVSGAQGEHLHRASRASQKHPTFPRPRKDVGTSSKKSAVVPVLAAQGDDPPPKSFLNILVYPCSEVEARPHTYSPFEDQLQLHNWTPVCSYNDPGTARDLHQSPGAHRRATTTVSQQISEDVTPQKSGKLPRSASPIPFTEGRSSGNLAARKYSAARETQARKGKVPLKVTNITGSDLSTCRGPRPPATGPKATAEENPLLQAHPHTKKGHQDKQCMPSPRPITTTTESQKGQGFIPINTLWTVTPPSSLRVEGQVVGNTNIKMTSSAGDSKLDRLSSKVSKRIIVDLIPNRAEDQATEHLAGRDAAKKLKWGKAASPIKIAPQTSNLQTAKRRISSTQAAQATWGGEVFKQNRTTLLRSTGETEHPQPAAATAADIQADGIHSTVNMATGNTKIIGQTNSTIKVVDKPTCLHSARPKELAPTTGIRENKYSTKGKGLLAAKDNVEIKEPKALKKNSKQHVHHTLYTGRVKLLPLMYNPEEAKRWKDAKCDLKITGISVNHLHGQVDKPQK